jgi:tetratricopeptide (TPR) repeat protein
MKRYALVLVILPPVAVSLVVFAFAMRVESESLLLRQGDALAFEDLRTRTFQMIERDPSNTEIYFANTAEFLARPEYHAEVLRRLEERIKAKPSHHAYWVLALMCERRALAPHFRTDDDRRRFLKYYELDSDAGLPKQTNETLVAKTIEYYKKAGELAASEWWRFDSFSSNFYARQLVDFYSRLDRHPEALDLCKVLAERKANLSDASFLLAYGEALYAAGKPDEAEKWLLKVRENDNEGWQHGPACHTVDAETTLGLIALGRGDIDAAVKHLHASTNVEKCCHNSTKGFPTTLASKLLDKGKTAAVVEFCETVLRDFTAHADYLEALLGRANMASKKKAKS